MLQLHGGVLEVLRLGIAVSDRVPVQILSVGQVGGLELLLGDVVGVSSWLRHGMAR